MARWLSKVAAALLMLGCISAALASGTADFLCNDILGDLRKGDFEGATQHFDDPLKALLSPDKLATTWQGIVLKNGKLVSWQITQRTQIVKNSTRGPIEVIVAPLQFEKTSEIAAQIAVNLQSNKVSGFHFVPAPRAEVSRTTPPYADPKKFVAQDVKVGAPPWELPGTITIPTSGKGPWPAVLMLTGSGPNDRDESLGPNHPFKDIAEGLSSCGIVALRYDKRTRVYRDKIDLRHITVQDEYLDDAIAAVKLLRSRKEIASDHIFILGHSLGANIAPEVALKVQPVQGVILLAPSGQKLGKAVVQQMRFLGEASTAQLAELEQKANQLDNHQLAPTDNFMGTPASYFYDLDARNEVAVARQLGVPILILHGGRDYAVIDEDIQHWQQGLKGVAHVQVEAFPALNHLFIAGVGEPRREEYMTPGHVDEKVVNAIAAFIANPTAK
jgi:dienelactone hydrolase